jgi:hypothetical protein
VGRRLRLALDWGVDMFYKRDSAEWIPPRLPRITLGVLQDPDAVEVSMTDAEGRSVTLR